MVSSIGLLILCLPFGMGVAWPGGYGPHRAVMHLLVFDVVGMVRSKIESVIGRVMWCVCVLVILFDLNPIVVLQISEVQVLKLKGLPASET